MFGIIYKATRLNPDSNQNKIVAIKRFRISQNISKTFLNEIIIFIHFSGILFNFLLNLYECYESSIIRYSCITRDPDTKEYMLMISQGYL